MLKTAEIDRFENFSCPRPAGGKKLALLLTIAFHAVVIATLAAITFQVTRPAIEPAEIEVSFSPSPTTPIDPAQVENVAKQKPQVVPAATAPQLVELPYEPVKLEAPEIVQPEVATRLPAFDEVVPEEEIEPASKPAPKKKTTVIKTKPTSESKAQPRPPVFTQAKVRTRARPIYPESARRKGQQGTVHVRLSVSSSGKVTAASLSRSSGSSALDASAVKAAKRWRFTPAKSGSTPVATKLVVPISFRLQ